MNITANLIDNTNDRVLVTWSPKYATGIKRIDMQHRELVSLTNELYQACFIGDVFLDFTFKETMSRMVEYVRFHFADELKILEHIRYPNLSAHRREHETLINNIAEAVIKYHEKKKFVPNIFVRTLKE